MFKLSGTFETTPGYVGVSRGQGHMNVWAMPAAKRRIFGGDCPGTRPAPGSVRVQGAVARFIDCPPGSGLDGGHVVLEWRAGAIAYGVSAHGHSEINRRLVLFVAQHLKRLPAA